MQILDCGEASEIEDGTKLTLDSKMLEDGSVIESYIRYQCNPGFLLNSGSFATGYNAHLHLFCANGMDGEMPKWNQISLPECLAGKTEVSVVISR